MHDVAPKGLELEFRAPPSTMMSMLRALYPSPGLKRDAALPAMRARWLAHRAGSHHLEDFVRLTGIGADAQLPLLYLHTISFRLQFVLLTHPIFPLPIWRVLQVRNHMLQHRPILVGETIDLEARTVGQRVLEKGVELELHTTVTAGGHVAWESLSTYYVRGRFGDAQPASPLATAPDASAEVVARWRMPSGDAKAFARLSGDCNGIHIYGWYARRLGFAGAFNHTQRVLGQCLAHLPTLAADRPQRLDAWLKGPVYYDTDVSLRAGTSDEQVIFALHSNDDPRPAIVGSLRSVAPGSRLF